MVQDHPIFNCGQCGRGHKQAPPPCTNSWYSYNTWAWLGVVDITQIFDTLSRLVGVQRRTTSNDQWLIFIHFGANTTTGQNQTRMNEMQLHNGSNRNLCSAIALV